jgi:hypothetical protein
VDARDRLAELLALPELRSRHLEGCDIVVGSCPTGTGLRISPMAAGPEPVPPLCCHGEPEGRRRGRFRPQKAIRTRHVARGRTTADNSPMRIPLTAPDEAASDHAAIWRTSTSDLHQ